MFFEQIYDKTLAQASYIVSCQVSKEAIVIDPKRDVDTYLQIAKANNLNITHVAETHIHADFLSGSRELVELTGAKLFLSDEGGVDWQYEFPHIGLKHDDVIPIGNLTLKVMHTPGHTPESISFLLTDHPATDRPVMLFTGDFVFVGDVGRPDLLEEAAGVIGSKEIGAKQLFESLKMFKSLPDYIQVWPGHGAGSACGKALGAVASTTVGYEKIRNWALQYEDFEAFKDELLKDQPEAPYYFAMMKKLNKVTRNLLTEVPNHPIVGVDNIPVHAIVVDTRNKFEFANGHLPKSINIQNNNSLANWSGWMLPYDRPLILVAEEGNKEEITRKLMRIGMDNVQGYIVDIGNNLKPSKIVDAEYVKSQLETGESILLDVRNTTEFKKAHIQGAKHHFVGHLAKVLPNLDKDAAIIIQCQSGDRATIATSYLEKLGFTNVTNYSGSMLDWLAKGNQVVN
ncbi:MBL fold metallo-hydrolase [Sphingobacterium bovistauri]|uniref:MBL fold metallo-hydrolase n=1 Tax=Sphingobacterium bovistauri TaxID=2781959 RepID=A0ABS7Z6U5_9SPHI|nr:MBL fold metallo-hydrolase [Sphingobacterium bovistauri]MCA5004674.1 MBL fold metallo-hydrolase [Sphingobacterium bovistauri]